MTPEEYRERHELGYGEIYSLDFDACAFPVPGRLFWRCPGYSKRSWFKCLSCRQMLVSTAPSCPGLPPKCLLYKALGACRVEEAPWRAPGADLSAYFNFDMTQRDWLVHVVRVACYRLKITMEHKPTWEPNPGLGSGLVSDPVVRRASLRDCILLCCFTCLTKHFLTAGTRGPTNLAR